MVRIVVVGKAEHHQAAERGTLHLQVRVMDESADKAVERATVRHNEVVARVKGLVEVGAVTWWSAGHVLAGAFYEWHKPSPDVDSVKVLRFHAMARLKIKFCDFEALARFSTTVAKSPDVEVGLVDWALTEVRRNQIVPKVRATAALDATRRAQEYADGLGLGPVRLVALYDEGLRPDVGINTEASTYGTRGERLAGGRGNPEPTIQPEDVTITTTVTADFDADPA